MATVYVLKSRKNGKRYIGSTSRTAEERLREHNSGNTSWTNKNRPFELIYQEKWPNIKLARRKEKMLKSGKGRAFLDELLNQ